MAGTPLVQKYHLPHKALMMFLTGATAPVAGTNAAPCPVSNITRYDLVSPEMIERGNVAGTLSPLHPLIGSIGAGAGFTVDLAGEPTGGPWLGGVLLQACGFAKSGTTNGFTFALGDYHLASGSPAGSTVPVSCALWDDGAQWGTLTSAVGDVEISWLPGQIPTAKFELLGLSGATYAYSNPASPATLGTYPMPSAQYAADVTYVSPALTQYTGMVADSIVFRTNNQYNLIPDVSGTVGYKAPIITNRAPTLSLSVQQTEAGAAEWTTYWASRAQLNLYWTHTTAAADSAAGVITYRKINCSMSGILAERPRVKTLASGVMGVDLTFMQAVEGSPIAFTMAWTTA